MGQPDVRFDASVPDIHQPYRAASDRYTHYPYRRVGRSGLLLPPISLGLWWNFGDEHPFATQRRILTHAFDKGINHFDLADDLSVNPQYRTLIRVATLAAEQAKIELSQKDESAINAPDTEIGVRDQAGEEIYLDIPITRKRYDELIASKIDESIQATRETLEKAGLTANDIEKVVFVGGPTHYRPLRDRVAQELAISASTEVNPMTAVAEGAAVFAESIDWKSQSRGRKSSKGTIVYDIGGGGADISPMAVDGVPLVGYRPDSHRYFDVHHSRHDVFASVNERELELGAACMATMIFIVADLEAALPRNRATQK